MKDCWPIKHDCLLMPRNAGIVFFSGKCLTLRNKICLLLKGIIRAFRMSSRDFSQILFKSVAGENCENRAILVSFISASEWQGFSFSSYFKKNEMLFTWEICDRQRIIVPHFDFHFIY